MVDNEGYWSSTMSCALNLFISVGNVEVILLNRLPRHLAKRDRPSEAFIGCIKRTWREADVYRSYPIWENTRPSSTSVDDGWASPVALGADGRVEPTTWVIGWVRSSEIGVIQVRSTRPPKQDSSRTQAVSEARGWAVPAGNVYASASSRRTQIAGV